MRQSDYEEACVSNETAEGASKGIRNDSDIAVELEVVSSAGGGEHRSCCGGMKGWMT